MSVARDTNVNQGIWCTFQICVCVCVCFVQFMLLSSTAFCIYLGNLLDEIMCKQTQNAQIVPLCRNKFMFSKQALRQNGPYLEIITTTVSQPKPQL